jgi:deoxyribodipyrimidine photo-lyase
MTSFNRQLNIVWHGSDLRTYDHRPLLEAASLGPTLGLYIDQHDPAAAFYAWTRGALKDLASYYASLGSHLLYFEGKPKNVFDALLKELEEYEVHVYMHLPKAPDRKAAYEEVHTAFTGRFKMHFFDTDYLVATEVITNNEGAPIRVFTPFYKRFLMLDPPRAPLSAPKKLIAPKSMTPQLQKGIDQARALPSWGSTSQWDKKLSVYYSPSRKNACEALKEFKPKVGEYGDFRNDPTIKGTSQLSMYLASGLISPHEIYHQLKALKSEAYIRQLIWREFASYLLNHYPEMIIEPFNPKFSSFKWTQDLQALEKWKRGETGYPFIDAAMRALWETGWMHNRLRMVVGSFLVKDLLIHWIEGAKWFEHTLIDLDTANNIFGWQWVGGMGPDAAPFFRIFNPILQSQKFDPKGEYIRKYVPELKNLETKYLHAPWEAPQDILEKAGVKLGETYPVPMVNHKEASKQAKAAFEAIKEG